MYTIADIFSLDNGSNVPEGVDSLTVSAWQFNATNFPGGPPSYGDSPPAGTADATTMTSESWGTDGSWSLSVPYSGDYYVLVDWPATPNTSEYYWKLYTAWVLAGEIRATASPAPPPMSWNTTLSEFDVVEWLPCDGSAQLQSDYPGLFQALTIQTTMTYTAGHDTAVLPVAAVQWLQTGMPVSDNSGYDYVSEGTVIADINYATGTVTVAPTFAHSSTGAEPFIVGPWGLGDGETTFNLPDLRDRVLIGVSNVPTSFEITGNTTNGSSSVTGVSSVYGLTPGTPISGSGIPANTTISALTSSTSFTLSANATATASNVGLTVLPAISITGNVTSGSTTMTNLSSVTGLRVGQAISNATYLPAGTTITALLTSTSIAISNGALSTHSGASYVVTDGVLSPRDLGVLGGLEVVTLTASESGTTAHSHTDNGHSHTINDPTHNHGLDDPGHGHGYQIDNAPGGSYTSAAGGDASDTATAQTYGNYTYALIAYGPTNLSNNPGNADILPVTAEPAASAHNNIQPFGVINYVIKT